MLFVIEAEFFFTQLVTFVKCFLSNYTKITLSKLQGELKDRYLILLKEGQLILIKYQHINVFKKKKR